MTTKTDSTPESAATARFRPHQQHGKKAEGKGKDDEGSHKDHQSPIEAVVHVKSLSLGADAERATLEAQHAKKLTAILRKQLRTILPKTTTPSDTHGVVARLHAAEGPLKDALYAMLLEGALLGASHGREQVQALQGTSKA
jgi:hypothetical protein